MSFTISIVVTFVRSARAKRENIAIPTKKKYYQWILSIGFISALCDRSSTATRQKTNAALLVLAKEIVPDIGFCKTSKISKDVLLFPCSLKGVSLAVQLLILNNTCNRVHVV